MSNIINLELWGGSHQFDTNQKIFKLNRQYGLFSNITVAIYGIAKIKTLGYDVDSINFYLAEYAINYDFYHDLFISSHNDLLSFEEADKLINTIQPTSHGLTRGWNMFFKEDLDKVRDIAYKVYTKYFSPNNDVLLEYENITKKNNINFQKTAFIWARKTDKTNEIKIPSANEYYDSIKNINSIDSILVQTDDNTVVDEFLSIKDSRINILNDIPLSDSKSGFHERLYSITDKSFIEKYNMSKISYLQKIFAMVNTASKCEYVACYPGNLTTMIPLIRKSFHNCILF